MRDSKLMKKLFTPEQILVEQILFIASVTIGIILLIGGLFLVAIALNLPATPSSEIESITQSVALIIDQIPGVPVNINDLTSLTLIGVVSWITGLNILLIGLGLWVKSKLAKWIAFGVFAFAAITDLFQFLLSGIIGAPGAVPGILINAVFLYFIYKLDF